MPAPQADTGTARAHPELFAEAALRLELPGRSAAQIASILYHRHGIALSERTVRGQLHRAGRHREALAAERRYAGRETLSPTGARSGTSAMTPACHPAPSGRRAGTGPDRRNASRIRDVICATA